MIFRFALHEVNTATNVLSIGVRSHELEVKLVAAGGDAVGARVVRAVNTALCRTGRALPASAEGVVPRVARVAVCRALDGVRPSPVRVEDDGAGDVGAGAASGALLPCEGRVGLGLGGADLLGAGGGREGKEGGEFGLHCECLDCGGVEGGKGD